MREFAELIPFSHRHIGPNGQDRDQMLKDIHAASLDLLLEETIPADIRGTMAAGLPAAAPEPEALAEFRRIAQKNHAVRSMIGMGYYPTYMPAAVLRSILENPGWYTAYTPYQAEISQGRLEMLFHFQTLVSDLAGLPVTGASLLDEATATGEAALLLAHHRKAARKQASLAYVAGPVFPQTLAVLRTRAEAHGIEVRTGTMEDIPWNDEGLFAVFAQYPDGEGSAIDHRTWIAEAKKRDVGSCLICDTLALALLVSPGDLGADCAVGSTQRFGQPMGAGGPHAAWLAVREELKRVLPGRIIGLSRDSAGSPAYRMALQTREQHIRREKATSNICTSQVLPAVLATAWALYHGGAGIQAIASHTHALAKDFAERAARQGSIIRHAGFFDTVVVECEVSSILERAAVSGYDLRPLPGAVALSFDELSTASDVEALLEVFATQKPVASAHKNIGISDNLVRNDILLPFPAFHEYRGEHALVRYLKKLENRDISLVHSMISLGSCTMKLNPAATMLPLSWPEWSQVHPFAPQSRMEGMLQVVRDLERWLAAVTGFAGVSLQPNSGAQGEYAGLLTIREWHRSRNDAKRNVILIPSSAHGTNPASAALAGLRPVVVQCGPNGDIDLADLEKRASENKDVLAGLMVTYPSTHGVFETGIRKACLIIHENGGQVYMDGANMNAQVGWTSPATIGADVCHLNLHKTFSIPHGGGGPGSGPIAVAAHLLPFLPGHSVVKAGGSGPAVSAAPWGSGSILCIPWLYIRMMGAEGLKDATANAILNANWLMHKLSEHYSILYTGPGGRCAHEFIVDLRPFKKCGIEAEDVAKRLMDFGFHAPTVSFPVPGTLMIEPTESEPLSELQCFSEAMAAIREEIRAVEEGRISKDDNPLKRAPHTVHAVLGDWDRAYSREQAAFPLAWVREAKVWPSVGRIDNAYGDRTLVCSCPPVDSYQES